MASIKFKDNNMGVDNRLRTWFFTGHLLSVNALAQMQNSLPSTFRKEVVINLTVSKSSKEKKAH